MRALVVETTRKKALHAEIRSNVAPDSALYTNALKAYDGLTEYDHQTIDHADTDVRGNVHTCAYRSIVITRIGRS